jgi:hypothetical protein
MPSMALGTGGQEGISATPWLACGWTGNAATIILGLMPGHRGSAKQTHDVPVVPSIKGHRQAAASAHKATPRLLAPGPAAPQRIGGFDPKKSLWLGDPRL